MIEPSVAPSSTLALLQKVRELKQNGEDLVSFAAGEADFDTPSVIIEAAYESMKEGNTRYVSTPGQDNFREAIAKDYRERLNCPWVQKENIVNAAGTKQAIFLALLGVINPKEEEEVLIPCPYWVSYPGVTRAAGGVPVFVDTQAEEKYFPTTAALEEKKSSKTKALILSSPSNPTGTMIDSKRLEEITTWCVQNKIVFIYDEIYERLALADNPHVSALSVVDEAQSEYIIAVNAFSKCFAMTGWRLGFAVSHHKNIAALSPLQGQILTCMPGFVQDAAIAGLEAADTLMPEIVESFRKRLGLLKQELEKIPSIQFVPPSGAFYAFLDMRQVMKEKKIQDDKTLAQMLLEKAKVVMNPGSSFGMPGYLRLSFATSETEITRGLERLRSFCG